MRDPDPSLKIGRLKRRADFLRAAKGRRWHSDAMTVQASPATISVGVTTPLGVTTPASVAGVRVGFTLTRKVGNAVVRNRARRRLKEAVRLSPDLPVAADHDYVIVGRIAALSLSFETLKRDLARAIRGVHESGRAGRQRSSAGKRTQAAVNHSDEIRPKRTRPEP